MGNEPQNNEGTDPYWYLWTFLLTHLGPNKKCYVPKCICAFKCFIFRPFSTWIRNWDEILKSKLQELVKYLSPFLPWFSPHGGGNVHLLCMRINRINAPKYFRVIQSLLWTRHYDNTKRKMDSNATSLFWPCPLFSN